jgi:hypothetical protein
MLTPNPFVPDPATERWIESYGVTWTLKTIPLSEIDTETSHKNQARHHPVKIEAMVSYGDAMAVGDLFPAPVVYVLNGRYVNIDGNQRTGGAARVGVQEATVYVLDIEPSDPRLLDMVASANARLNGYSHDDEDRIAHAIAMVDRGKTQKDAAREMGMTDGQLRSHLYHARLTRHCDRLGLGPQARSLPKHYSAALFGDVERFNQEELRAIIHVASLASSRDDFRALVKEAAASRDGERLKVIEGFRNRRSAVNAKPKPAGNKTAYEWFNTWGGGVAKLVPQEVVATCPTDKREAMARLADELRFVATRIASA